MAGVSGDITLPKLLAEKDDITLAKDLLAERRELINRIAQVERLLNMLSKKCSLRIDFTNDVVEPIGEKNATH